MSHPSQLCFVKDLATLLESIYPSAKIVEIGSADVNGTVRIFFKFSKSYCGIDLVEYPGVDTIANGHEFGDSNTFDITLSCEALEHNPYWLETFVNMVRITRPGGCVLFTCASRGRMEHGTERTEPEVSPGTTSRGWSYYRNLSKRDFTQRVDLKNHFSAWRFFYNKRSKDLYFIGIKNEWDDGKLKNANWLKDNEDLLLRAFKKSIEVIERSSFFVYLAKLPLSAAAFIFPDHLYQSFAMRYFPLMRKIYRKILCKSQARQDSAGE